MEIAKTLTTEVIPHHQPLLDIMRIVMHELHSPVSNLIEALTLLEDELQKTYSDREAIAAYLKLISVCKDNYKATQQRFVDALSADGCTYSTTTNEVISIRKIRDRTHDEFKAKLVAKKINFSSSVHGNVPLLLYGDPIYLQQIIRNILSNAIKYTPVDGIVGFSCEQVDTDMYQFIISDTGIGIPADSLQRIFEPGYRIGASPIPGEGMGLAIVYDLVKRLNGSVCAENLEQGTKFTVTLPLRSFLR